MRILNRVCRSDQAEGQNGAPRAADAVPAAIPDTAFASLYSCLHRRCGRIGRGLTRSRACSSSGAGAAGGGAKLPRRLGGLPHALQVVVLPIAEALFFRQGDHLASGRGGQTRLKMDASARRSGFLPIGWLALRHRPLLGLRVAGRRGFVAHSFHRRRLQLVAIIDRPAVPHRRADAPQRACRGWRTTGCRRCLQTHGSRRVAPDTWSGRRKPFRCRPRGAPPEYRRRTGNCPQTPPAGRSQA